jgi:SAM-dependent methyltransferase
VADQPNKSKLFSFLFPRSSYNVIQLEHESSSLAFKLCPENFGRAVVLSQFIEQSKRIFSRSNSLRVAVVGGYYDEPEIRALRELGFTVEVSIFGIEEDMQYLDLNIETGFSLSLNAFDKYDLILCSQVWEHIWNHESAFANLLKLMSKDSYLWLACPASNHPHGSPSYFSAGFTYEYLSLNVKKFGLATIAAGQIGTPRNYRATHAIPTWLSVRGHSFPPLYAFEGKSLLSRLLHSMKYLFLNISFLSLAPTITDDSRFATESWVLAQKQC